MAELNKKGVKELFAPAFWLLSSSYLFVYALIDAINSRLKDPTIDGIELIIAGALCLLAYISYPTKSADTFYNARIKEPLKIERHYTPEGKEKMILIKDGK